MLLLVGHAGLLDEAGTTLLIIHPFCKPEKGLVELCPSQGGRDQLSAVLVPSFLTPKITRECVCAPLPVLRSKPSGSAPTSR